MVLQQVKYSKAERETDLLQALVLKQAYSVDFGWPTETAWVTVNKRNSRQWLKSSWGDHRTRSTGCDWDLCSTSNTPTPPTHPSAKYNCQCDSPTPTLLAVVPDAPQVIALPDAFTLGDKSTKENNLYFMTHSWISGLFYGKIVTS